MNDPTNSNQGTPPPAPAAPAAPSAAPAPAAAPQAPAGIPVAQFEELRAANTKLQEQLEANNKRWGGLAAFFKDPEAAPAELPPQVAAQVSQAHAAADAAWRALRVSELAFSLDAHSPADVANMLAGSKAFAVDANGALKDPKAAEAEVAAFKARKPWAFRAPPAPAAPAAPDGTPTSQAVTPAPGMLPPPPSPTNPAPANPPVITNPGKMSFKDLKNAVKQLPS